MSIKYVLIPVLVLASLLPASSQSTGQQSLFMFNKFQFNPAYAGLDYSLSINAFLRRQWVGLEGNPANQGLNAHLPLGMIRGGLGVGFGSESLGAERTTELRLAYSYHLEVGDGLLGLGLAAGFFQRSLDGSLLRTPEGVYDGNQVIDHNDATLPAGEENGSAPVFDVGVFFRNEWLDAGVSVQQLNQPVVTLTNTEVRVGRTVNLYAGARFELGYAIDLEPSVIIRSDLIQTQAEAALLIRYNDNIFGGASFRGYSPNTRDAVNVIAGFRISEKLALAYAYDITLSSLQQVNNGSHGLLLNYNLNQPVGQGRPPRIIYNPRTSR